MNKNQKIILFGALFVFLCLIALIIVLIVKNSQATRDRDQVEEAYSLQEQLDLAREENDRLKLDMLTNEFNQLNNEFESQLEGNTVELANDSLVRQYNEAKNRVNNLIKELDREKKSNKGYQEKIKQLESEIATLKDIAKHYLEEIRRLNEENEGLRQELSSAKGKNETLERENATISRERSELAETVQQAKKLNITGLTLQAYNKKDKTEKNITKAKKLGVSFTVTPNNTAAPGMKDFYVRIISPEGTLLGSGPAFGYDGATVTSTASRQMEYANEELSVSVFWNVNTTLTPGDYTVEVFADGYRLKTGRFNMKK